MLSSNMKCKQQFFIGYLGGGGGGGGGVGGRKYLVGEGGSKYRTIFWPPGRVGIAFCSVKKSIITIQEITDMI